MEKEYVINFVGGRGAFYMSATEFKKFYKRITNSTRKQDAVYTTENGSVIYPSKITFIESVIAPTRPMQTFDEPEALINEETNEEGDTSEDNEEGCDHSNLPIGFTTTTQGVKRYHHYCEVCGYKSTLIRHAELPEDQTGFIDLMKD